MLAYFALGTHVWSSSWLDESLWICRSAGQQLQPYIQLGHSWRRFMRGLRTLSTSMKPSSAGGRSTRLLLKMYVRSCRQFSNKSLLVVECCLNLNIRCRAIRMQAITDVERAVLATLEKHNSDVLAPLKEVMIPKKFSLKYMQKLTRRRSLCLYTVPSQVLV